jgi:hypothetical protein
MIRRRENHVRRRDQRERTLALKLKNAMALLALVDS